MSRTGPRKPLEPSDPILEMNDEKQSFPSPRSPRANAERLPDVRGSEGIAIAVKELAGLLKSPHASLQQQTEHATALVNGLISKTANRGSLKDHPLKDRVTKGNIASALDTWHGGSGAKKAGVTVAEKETVKGFVSTLAVERQGNGSVRMVIPPAAICPTSKLLKFLEADPLATVKALTGMKPASINLGRGPEAVPVLFKAIDRYKLKQILKTSLADGKALFDAGGGKEPDLSEETMQHYTPEVRKVMRSLTLKGTIADFASINASDFLEKSLNQAIFNPRLPIANRQEIMQAQEQQLNSKREMAAKLDEQRAKAAAARTKSGGRDTSS